MLYVSVAPWQNGASSAVGCRMGSDIEIAEA